MTTNIDHSYGLPVDIVAPTPPPDSNSAAPPFREHLESRRNEAPQRVESAPKDEPAVEGPPSSASRDDEATRPHDASEQDKLPGSAEPNSDAGSAADADAGSDADESRNTATHSSNEDTDSATTGNEAVLIDRGGIPAIEDESPPADEADIESPPETLPTVASDKPPTSESKGNAPAITPNSGESTDNTTEVHLASRLTHAPDDPKPTPLSQPAAQLPKETDGKKDKSEGKYEQKGKIDAVIEGSTRESRQVNEKGEDKAGKEKNAGRATVAQGWEAAKRNGKSSGDPDNRGGGGGTDQTSASKEERRSKGSRFDEAKLFEPAADGAKPNLRTNKIPILISREISELPEALASEMVRDPTTDILRDSKSTVTSSVPVDGDAVPTASPKDDGSGNRLSTLLSPNGSSESRQQPPLNDAQQARLVQRVTKAFDVARARGESTVRLRLAPPELGSLRLEVQVESGSLIARLEVETSAAREVLLDNLNTLRQRLGEQGIRVDQFDVELLDRQSDDRWQSGDQDQHNHDAPGDDHRRADTDDREQAAPKLPTSTTEQLLDEGIIDVII